MARPKSIEKRGAMICAAKSLFLAANYTDVSMSQISLKAGLSKNTLYSHFPNKEALFKAVLANHWDEQSMPSIDPFDTRDIQTVLEEFASNIMEFVYREDTIGFFRILVAESVRFPNLSASIVENNTGPIQTNIKLYFSQQTDKSKAKIELIANSFDSLLTLTPLWHMLVGYKKRFTPQMMTSHIQQTVTHFVKTYDLV
jgi:AcrR family transcriptional regulator